MIRKIAKKASIVTVTLKTGEIKIIPFCRYIVIVDNYVSHV